MINQRMKTMNELMKDKNDINNYYLMVKYNVIWNKDQNKENRMRE